MLSTRYFVLAFLLAGCVTDFPSEHTCIDRTCLIGGDLVTVPK